MTHLSPHNEWDELEAAQRSEAELLRIMTEGPGKVTSRELELARRDAMRAMVVGLPDPVDVALYLETADYAAATTLKAARIDHKAPYYGCYRVADNEHVALLRSMGLVGWIGDDRNAGCAVGNFGLMVRKIMLGEVEEAE